MKTTTQAEAYIDQLVESLAVSETRYEQAERSYKSLGEWLCRPESSVRAYGPKVYIQGSFGLGTTIRPTSEEEDYDVDSVCEFEHLTSDQLTQEHLKQLLGAEIAAYHRAQSMTKPIREGRRCWVLNYAEGAQFHMDVVPAVPNAQRQRMLLESRGLDASFATTAIGITDNERDDYSVMSQNWPRSNPKGYITWFRSRMTVELERRRRILAEAAKASVEDIPEYRIRTPLQSAIMILKRHRDMRHEGDACDKPISIIITTLAAHAYRGEDNISDALVSILANMENGIVLQHGKYHILNPSDPTENFADKWEEYPERAEAFFEWLKKARADFLTIAQAAQRELMIETASAAVGERVAKAAGARGGGGALRAASVAPAGAGLTFPDKPRVPTNPQGFA